MSLILHLSDLHLGPVRDEDIPDDYKSDIVPLAERTSRLTILKETLTQLAVQLKGRKKELDAVVISGDITVKSSEDGYRRLEEVLSWLGDVCPRRERIVVVPGNHDVVWEVSDAATRYRHFITYVRDKGFVTPLLEGIDIQNEKLPDDLSQYFLLDRDRQWAIVPINSSHYCGSREPLRVIPTDVWEQLPANIARSKPDLDESVVAGELRHLRLRDVARISRDQLNAIRALALAVRAKIGTNSPDPILIGAMHHQLLPVTIREEFKPFESITNLGHLRYVLRDNQFSVLLHGHKHTGYVYFDYIHRLPDGDLDSPHRVLVISAPSAKGSGDTFSRNICTLIETTEQAFASTLSLTDVPCVEHGTTLRLPQSKSFPLWQTTAADSLKSSPVHLVEGNSVDEVYERALSIFHRPPVARSVSNLICRVAEATDPVQLPVSYPPIKDVSESDRADWFKRTVDWWQKRDFRKLSGDHHFNHGNRIFRYDRNVDQLDRVATAIKRDPLTSRGVVSLLKPHSDEIQTDSRFPSFSFTQFVVRTLSDVCLLDVIAFFRKQEIRYWWPVNIAELSRLQSDVFSRVASVVSGKLKCPLRLGSITTISAIAHVGTEIPYILVPAIDFDLEESPQKLWDMTYAVCWEAMDRRQEQVRTWEHVLVNLIPPPDPDSAGVLVPIQGIEYLAEISEHFSRNHTGDIRPLALQWKELERTNRRHAKWMSEHQMHDRDEQEWRKQHDEWRSEVLAKLNSIRELVNRVFKADIRELK